MPRGGVARGAQGRILKFLSFLNWAVLTLSVVASLVGAVICLLTWPFPQIADQGTAWADVRIATELALAVTLFAALATWLTDKRHPAYWIAETVFAVVVLIAVYYGIASR